MDLLFLHLANSLWRLGVGVSFAIAIGILTGLVFHRSWLLRQVCNWMMTNPTMVWVPILMIFLGTGSLPVIAAIFLASVFAVSYEMAVGVSNVSGDVVEAAMLDGAHRLRLSLWILLPCALPHLLAGVRLAFGYGLRALIGAEMLAATLEWGLGKVLFQAWFWNDMPMAMSALGMVIMLGVILDSIMGSVGNLI